MLFRSVEETHENKILASDFFSFKLAGFKNSASKFFTQNYTIGIEVYRVSAIDYLSYK